MYGDNKGVGRDARDPRASLSLELSQTGLETLLDPPTFALEQCWEEQSGERSHSLRFLQVRMKIESLASSSLRDANSCSRWQSRDSAR